MRKSKISQHEVWLKSLGYKKLNPRDRFYPVGGPDGPGTAIYQKADYQVGLYADGSWDRSNTEGLDFNGGNAYESLVREVRS